MKEWKIRQWVYHKSFGVDDDVGNFFVYDNDEQMIIDTTLQHFTESMPRKLIFPAKSYFVAIIYATLIQRYFGGEIIESLKDPELLFKNTPMYQPYTTETKNIYDTVLSQMPTEFNVKLPQVAATIEYFEKEFLLHKDTEHLLSKD